MATKVEQSIKVHVPVRTAYDQWTQFEEFPRFMGGVQEIRQTSDDMTHWVVEIGGVRREFDARILDQVPDTKVAWAAVTGATNAGAVYFTPLGPEDTSVRLEMEYEPEGVVEKVGDALNLVERRAKADLEKFKEFIEGRGTETGGWRGDIDQGASAGTPGVEAASPSRGDSGGAGVSPVVAAAGAAVAAAGVAAVARAVTKDDDSPAAPATGTSLPATGTATSAGSAESAAQAEPLEPLPVEPTSGEAVPSTTVPSTALPGDDPVSLTDPVSPTDPQAPGTRGL